VRIHLFGDLDNGIADDVAQTKRPSFEAMKKSLDDDPLVKSEMLKAELDLESEFDEEDEPAAAPKGEPAGLFDDLLGDSKPKPRAWQLDFETDSKGNILSSLTNIRLIIMNDKRLRGRIQYSEFTQDIRTRLPLNPRLPDMLPTKVADPLTGELWTDYHDKVVRAIIESPRGKNGGGYGLKVSDRDLKNTVEIVARQFAYHPVKEFVEGITWDGVPRVETLFIDYLGAPDNPYTRETARAMLTALVTRTYEPGHKFDYVVVLEGAQGKRKSTFIEALAGCPLWFVEMTGDLGDRKGIVEKMQNKTICEFPELAGFTKADVEDLKALISSHSDTVRFAFAESAQDYKRKSIFIGSTNDKQYLRDLTGGRRFWPMAVLVDEIDTDAFAKIVPQLWAEARAIYLKMRAAQPMGNLPLFLRNRHSQKIAAALQENARQHVSEDLWKGLFEEYLDSPLVIEDDDADLDAPVKTRERFEVTLIELWTEVMGRARNDYRSGDGMILSRTMSMIKGWENIGPRRTVAHGMQRVYRKTAFDAHGNKTPERPVLKRKPIDMLD
jgi:predicted P-loop ATPase